MQGATYPVTLNLIYDPTRMICAGFLELRHSPPCVQWTGSQACQISSLATHTDDAGSSLHCFAQDQCSSDILLLFTSNTNVLLLVQAKHTTRWLMFALETVPVAEAHNSVAGCDMQLLKPEPPTP
jgi:hypothetical protein